jgi:uncharacterized DUF497 family protein
VWGEIVSSPVIVGFVFDEENEEKFLNHSVQPAQVEQVLGNPFVIIKNRRGRRARYLLIGRDQGGGYITVPIEKTEIIGYWRPITAWHSKRRELVIYKQLKETK